MNKEVIGDTAGKKTCNVQSSHSSIVASMTTEVDGGIKKPNAISTSQGNSIGAISQTHHLQSETLQHQVVHETKFLPAVIRITHDDEEELGNYNIAHHFLCDKQRNDTTGLVVEGSIGKSRNAMHIHIMNVVPGEREDIVLTPMERDWNSNDRLPDIFRSHDESIKDETKKKKRSPSPPKTNTDCIGVKQCVLPHPSTDDDDDNDESTTTNTPVFASDDKSKVTPLTTSSTTQPNHSDETTSSHPSCEIATTRSSSQHLRDNTDNSGGLVKSRISQIQQRIEVLSSSASSSDDRISPLSATSIADGRRKDNNCFIRTIPIGIAKSNARSSLGGVCGTSTGGNKTGSLSYTYSC